MRRKWPVLVMATLLVDGLAHIALLLPVDRITQTLAAMVIGAWAPGLLWAEWLLGGNQSPCLRAIRVLFGIGLGYSMLVWGTLWLSYLPGGLMSWQVLLLFDALLFLGLWLLWHRTPVTRHDYPQWASLDKKSRYWLGAGVIALMVVAGYTRFAQLDYAEFQGDEATPIVRAAAVVQGYEDVLFLHRKGPAEILIPASLLALTGRIDEASGRLPFAVANLVAVIGVWFLGWRFFHPFAGWVAAMFLASDGYFIGYSRMVQYESLLFLTSALTPLALCLAIAEISLPVRELTRHLSLAALLTATGLASHYDGIVILLPGVYLLWLLGRNGLPWRTVGHACLFPTLLAAVLLASFYIPFVFHPNFRTTYAFYNKTLVNNAGWFTNNLGYFAESMVLYNGAFKFYLLVLLTIGALVIRIGRQIGLWVAVGATWPQNLLWFWFGLPLFQSLFLTKTPGLHFHVFFIPWFLLIGSVLSPGALRLTDGPTWAGWLTNPQRAVGLLLVMLVLSAGHTYRFFLDRRELILRNLNHQPPPIGWPSSSFVYDQEYIGIPHFSGWKVIGALYAQGILRGDYTTNIDRWISDWYTRGAEYCDDEPANIFIELLAGQDHAAELHADMEGRYHHWGTVLVEDEPKLEIYRRGHLTETVTYDADFYQTLFDQMLSGAPLPLTSPAVTPQFRTIFYRFGDELALTGYSLHTDRARLGGHLSLALRWQLLRPVTAHYQLFVQVIGREGRMIGQRDAMPSCKTGPTSDWELPETPLGFYQIPIQPFEQPGRYPLYIGLYHEQTQERLPIYQELGKLIGDALPLTEVEVTPDQK